MSQAKISRIESGKHLPSVIDVERILTALGVPAEVSRGLVDLARVANVGYGSWRAFARIGLERKQVELMALEESSKVVRQFLPAIPTGLVQIPEYSREVLAARISSDSVRDVDRLVRARIERQRVLADETRQFVFLLTEQAVRWRQADADVMRRQTEHMVEVANYPNVELGVLPQSVEVRQPPMNIFVVYDERLVTVELFSGEVVLRDPRDIRYHLDLFEFFRQHALTGDAARDYLRTVSAEFM